MTHIGTREWGVRTQGRLRPVEKLTMVGMILRALGRDMAEHMRAALPGRSARLARIDLDAVPVPDSLLVRRTIEKAEEAYNRPLRLHCYRTYWWGALLAQVDNLRFDPELLMVASLLHDLGIAPDGAPVSQTCCFSVLGGQLAESFLCAQGYDPSRAMVVNEAISTHLNPMVDLGKRPVEAKLLAEGATLDVTGARSVNLPATALRAVDARYPRRGFIAEFAGTSLMARHPADTRPEFLKAGFRRLAMRNPLDRM